MSQTTRTVDPEVDLVEHYYEEGFSDGLPVAPPTPRKVDAAVAALGGDKDRVECRVPPDRKSTRLNSSHG